MKHYTRLKSLAFIATFALTCKSLCGSFLYNNFSSIEGLQLNGVAAVSNNNLRLTRSPNWEAGSVFTTTPTQLGSQNSFSVFFQFKITDAIGIGDADGAGADGLVFVIQTVSNNVGASGGGIGYQGITPSVGIEFDTFNNGSGYNDPDGNHVGINLNGDPASVVTASESVSFNNGQIWNIWVDYNGATQLLEARWSTGTARPSAAQLSNTVDLAALLNQNSAYIGFTAATGAGSENHDILYWDFRDSYNPVPSAPLRIPSLQIETASSLDFDTTLGQGYTIEESTDLTSWSAIQTGIIGDGSKKTFFYKNKIPKVFYRVSTSLLP